MTHLFRHALLLICLLMTSVKVLSQAWTVYNSSNSGLPFDAVNCIAFESGGIKWIGTEAGLASFDDTTWTVYTTSNSGLPDNAVRSIVIDDNNNKWIGTFLGGLAKFDGTVWTVFNALNSALPDDYIKALAIDTAGQKWIGTIQGMLRYDDTTFTVFDFSNAPFQLSDNIADIHIDSVNKFYVGTLNGGLIEIVDTIWTVYTIPNGSGIPDNTQLEVEPDHNGVLWMATPANGLVGHPGGSTWFVYNPFTSTMPSYATTSIEILENPDRVWIGTYDKGVVRKSGLAFTHYDNTNSPFPDVYADFVECDANGILWIGTQSGGLVRLDESLLTGLEEHAAMEVRIFPVPAPDRVTIATGLPVNAISVFGMEGKEAAVRFADGGNGRYHADVSDLAAGIYLARIVFMDGRHAAYKLVKN